MSYVSSVAASASGPQVGAAGPDAPGRSKTLAEVEADYTETVRKCRLLNVAAVRDECLRQAQRTLDHERARLRRAAR